MLCFLPCLIAIVEHLLNVLLVIHCILHRISLFFYAWLAVILA